MDTLKTAVIVVLLLAVVYGAYVILNKPDGPLPQEIAWHEQKATEPLQIDMGTATPAPAAASVASPASPAGAPWAAGGAAATPPAPFIHAELSPEEPAEIAATPEAKNVTPETPVKIAESEAAKASASATVEAPNLLAADTAPSPAKSETPPSAVGPADLPSLPILRDTPNGKSATPESEFALPPADVASLTRSVTPPSAKTEPVTPDTSTPASGSEPATDPDSKSEPENGKANVTTASVFEAAMREAHTHIESEEWYQALFVLSKFVQSPDLDPEQHEQLYNLLDPLAAKVVYSPESLVEQPYEVQRGDKLAEIAEKHHVPWELLANINGLQNPDLLVPGTKLKVVRGPFRAEVDLQNSELTLFAGQLYAGRFPISTGKDPAPKPGEYRVLEKQVGRVYYAGDGRTIAIDDPQNPYGKVWLGLGNDLCIHGSPEADDTQGLGCISLSPVDATDIFGILSIGSSVVIR